MKSYSQALKILKKSKLVLKDEKIKSLNCLNRVCAKNIYSITNYPTNNNSAFDGYALNSKDTKKLSIKKGKFFKILGVIAAGIKPKNKKSNKFGTFEIMTGGLLPKGFDTIIPKEKVSLYPNKKNPKYLYINKAIKKNDNVRNKGADYKKNDLIIKKGTIFKSNHILALKTLGIKYVKVKKIPNILFFSTGNEITNKDKILDWEVRNSISHYINSLNKNFLFNFKDGGILRDSQSNLFKSNINKMLKSKIDVIITSGAVSAGKFDFVPPIIKKFKLSNFFKDVAIRPGKPILFAKFKNKEKVFFGLPGNPISSAACFRFFVYPYLSAILNLSEEKPFKARLKNKFIKKKNFTRFLKGRLTSTNNGNLQVEILKGQESFRIKSFVKSNVWGVFKAGQSIFKKGQLIECHSPIAPNKNIFY